MYEVLPFGACSGGLKMKYKDIDTEILEKPVVLSRRILDRHEELQSPKSERSVQVATWDAQAHL